VIIENEFARVRVEFDTESHDPRLLIEDADTGMSICLDALELQGLAWARHEDLRAIVKPEFRELAAERFLGEALQEETVREAESILRRDEL
jgi:hypothetical protein